MRIKYIDSGSQVCGNRVVVEDEIIGTTHINFHRTAVDSPRPWRKPWHVVCHGRNFARLSEAINYLKEIKIHWFDEDEDDNTPPDRPVCHAEMTHSFLCNEASLDEIPY